MIFPSRDKRGFGRLEKMYRVVYSRRNIFGEEDIRGFTTTCDISLSGMKIFSTESMSGDVRLSLEIQLGHDRRLFLEGQVVWRQPIRSGYFIGIAFLNIDEAKRRIFLDSFFEKGALSC